MSASELLSIIGARVELDRPGDRLARCCANNKIGRIGPGDGKHALTLTCANCGARRGALGSGTAEMLADIVGACANPDALIVLRVGVTR
jgi:hypothetical protein